VSGTGYWAGYSRDGGVTCRVMDRGGQAVNTSDEESSGAELAAHDSFFGAGEPSMTDYEAIAKRLDNQGPIPSVLLCREAAAALRELGAERDRLLSEIEEILVSQEC